MAENARLRQRILELDDIEVEWRAARERVRDLERQLETERAEASRVESLEYDNLGERDAD